MTISGSITRIVFQNTENGWCVVKLKCDSGTETLVGYMPGIKVGLVVTADGDYVDDKKYGRQVKVKAWSEDLPANVNGIRRYLSDSGISGIGKVMAKRIVDKFGTDTFTILDEHPERLSEVQGIGEGRLERIKKSWSEYRELRKIISTIASFDISISKAYKIYKTYGADSVRVLQTDPYRLIDDVDGIGFKIADEIAINLGVPRDSYERIRSGLIFSLRDESSSGHCYMNAQDLIKKAMGKKVLDLNDRELVNDFLNKAIVEGYVIEEDGNIYLPMYYATEIKVAEMLCDLMSNYCAPVKPDFSSDTIEYDNNQKNAIASALNNSVFYITGGPGTGKTTIVKAIIKSFGNRDVLLAAPTGRAAKRLSEATGRSASTIHRLLEANFMGFNRNEDNQLRGDVLIVDECSMIDLMLMNALLKAVPCGMRLILVGDADQLPSVGPGSVLRDIIASGVIPGIRLTHIFRQAEMSNIVVNSHRIIEGECPYYCNTPDSDYFYLPAKDEDADTADYIVKLRKQLDGDVQVLAPMHRGDCGVSALNEKLQKAMNPNYGTGIKMGFYTFCKGDRVMQTKNDYTKGVFNGDIGTIETVNIDESELTVRFDDSIVSVTYTKNEASDELILAYAATIHKSQGSEYDVVIIPILYSNYIMLDRNLFYTAVTRAKKRCIVIGNKKSVAIAVHRHGAIDRNTTLAKRLAERGNTVAYY